MISKTQISKRIERKKNTELVETINLAKKSSLLELAKRISGPKRLYTKINLNELNNIKEDKIMIIGKVLGQGEIQNKKDVSALGFSEQAREKLKKAGCKINTIKEELEKNKRLEGIHIL